MKMKILYLGLIILFTIIVLLLAYIFQINRNMSLGELLDNNQQIWGEVDAVPNEDTAIKIANIILEAQSGFSEEYTYNIEVSFNEQSNTWEVYYAPAASVLGGGIKVHIQRSNGAITGMGYLP